MGKRVVITGMGIVSPIGNNLDDVLEGVTHGKCGIDKITKYDTTDRKVTLAAEVKDFDISKYVEKKDSRKLDLFVQYAIAAATDACHQAGIFEEHDEEVDNRERYGCIMSSGIGGIATTEREYERGMKRGFDMVSPHYIPMTISNMAAGHIAIRFGLHGMASCAVTACASSGNAIGDGFHYIRDGYADVMLVGGSESAITTLSIGGFTSLTALSTVTDKNRASIPFDKDRNGFVMGEGAACLCLEEYEHAKKRGAKILGEIVGYGANCDANHVTAPHPEGKYAAKCMELAIADAAIDTNDIDYINAHGTSTHLNDLGETRAVKTVFKDHAKELVMSSTKSMTGHLLGASAAVEAVITVLSMENNIIPPTINTKELEEELDLDYCLGDKAREGQIRYAMSNSFGFGGHNVSLVFKSVNE
ncbi:beta-ketoacyl-ACP synthase II [Lachnospira multipara]|uniref:beta-ketoacyl-ACP synthase II n=1 Tax=Lachnospira multipara TaxID=28051 RepID=UPI0004896837|nr:beta-ketoacyl-ACP synthase II [Lachnospira multipara]